MSSLPLFSSPGFSASSFPPAYLSKQLDEKQEDEEIEKSYIPLKLARNKLNELNQEMEKMKQKHVGLMNEVVVKYENMNEQSRAHFNTLLDEMKSRATLKLVEAQQNITKLQQQIYDVKKQHLENTQSYRDEIQQLYVTTFNYQNSIYDLEEEKERLTLEHAEMKRVYEERNGEIDRLMSTRVPKDDYDSLQKEKDDLSARYSESSESSSKRIAEIEAEVQRLNNQLDSINQEHALLKSQFATTEASYTSLKVEYDEHTAKSSERIKSLEESMRNEQYARQQKEIQVQTLELQVAAAASSGGGGGPATIIPIHDPEIQNRVRFLENEVNRYMNEKYELEQDVAKYESAIAQKNAEIVLANQAGLKSAPFAADGVALAAVAPTPAEEEPEEEQVSEYEDQVVDEVKEVEVIDQAGSEDDKLVFELRQQIKAQDEKLAELNEKIADFERILKPKVLEYKQRLQVFKSDSDRKELESKLGYDTITEADGSTHELRPADIQELELMLESEHKQSEEKAQLASRVGVLKENKKTLDANKIKLSDLKNEITEMKSQPDPPLDDIKKKEGEFITLRTQMTTDAAELKQSYAEYELQLNEYKNKEAELQKSFIKFKINPDVEEGKPRKLQESERVEIQKLLDMIKNKGVERDALKALADEVNTKNSSLKVFKSEKHTAEELKNKLQEDLNSKSANSAAPKTRIEKQVVKVTKRVKKPKRERVKRAAVPVPAPAPVISASGHISLTPIPLPKRSLQPVAPTLVEPMTFKPPPPIPSGGGGGGGSGPGQDPELTNKYKELTKKYNEVEMELDVLREKQKKSAGVSTEEVARKEEEIANLKQQIEVLQNDNPDERVTKVNAMLDEQRTKYATLAAEFEESKDELQEKYIRAQTDIKHKQQEIDSLKKEIQQITQQLKSAEARAKRAAASGGAVGVSGGGGGGGGGGNDAALIAERDDLQARVTELEEDLEKHKNMLHSSMAEKEAELKAQYDEKIADLEKQVAEGKDQITVIKKKAKEIHTNLLAEVAKRQGVEAELATSQSEFNALKTSAAEAINSMDKLKGEIKKREDVIEQKKGEITALENVREQLKQDILWTEERLKEEIKRRKEFQFKYEDAKGKVRVYARVRPFSKQEIANKEKTLLRPGKNDWTLELNETQRDVMGNITDKWREFVFDHVFHFGLDGTKGNASQDEVYEECSIFAELAIQGINTCIFAYGQSGTGKTFTMAGIKPSEENGNTTKLLGLKPRMIQRVYEMKVELKKTFDTEISCYMLEIYLNKIEDLFWKLETNRKYKGEKKEKWPEPPELKVRVDAKKKVSIDNIRICKFETAVEMQDFCDQAELMRRTRKTGLNEESSRSHLIFALMISSRDKKTGKQTSGKFSLVDLAGSERADKTNVDGLSKAQRDAMMEEGVAINESLRMLKNVFRILGSQHLPVAKGQKPEIVQYRGNMLTELMQDSLGGNAKTLMFVNVGPAASNISESIDSLQYGDYVKNITNEKATADEDLGEQIRYLKERVRRYEQLHGDLPDE